MALFSRKAAPRGPTRVDEGWFIDDDPDMRTIIERLFSNAGQRLRLFADADAALDALQEQRPPFILVDLDLPGTDGFAFAQTARTRPDCSDLVLIAFTSSHEWIVGDRVRQSGFDTIITKPLAAADLVDTLWRELADRGLVPRDTRPSAPEEPIEDFDFTAD
ncbi:MAG: response regulator [Candidatus Dadabacteria bacterium]|nr:MAG: response regulator [Candidatus Dadabacteria bacterium]